MAKKTQFGLKNVHIFKATAGASAVTYEAAIPIVGGINIELTPDNTDYAFEADDDASWYENISTNGYSGSFEVAGLPEDVMTDIFNHALSESNTISEKDTDGFSYFALTGERTVWEDGVTRTECFALPYCRATSVPFKGKTNKAGEPESITISFKAVPSPFTRKIRVISGSAAASTILSGWHGESADWMS